jgi:hypothetical protein
VWSLLLGCGTAIGVLALLAILVVNALPSDRPPTPQELRSIPDFALRYPGAAETTRFDKQGVYAAFNDQLTEARTTYRSRDTAKAVENWNGIELAAGGWVRKPDFRSTGSSTPTSFWRWCHPTIDADFWLGIDSEDGASVAFTVRLVSQSRRTTEDCVPG